MLSQLVLLNIFVYVTVCLFLIQYIDYFIFLNQAYLLCFHFWYIHCGKPTVHSANPEKFAHVLQKSRWRSSESLVEQYKYFVHVEDAGCGRGSGDRAL